MQYVKIKFISSKINNNWRSLQYRGIFSCVDRILFKKKKTKKLDIINDKNYII